jgi:hypothetical protein
MTQSATHSARIMNGKKYTSRKYYCSICNGSYSRKWVLTRHINTIHGLEEDAPNGGRRASKNRATNEPFSSGPMNSGPMKQQYYDERHGDQGHIGYSEQMKTLMEMAFRIAQNNYASILFNNIALSNTLNNITQNNVLIPLEEISGFSGYACPSCHTTIIVPIRDLGFDKTAKGRHVCRSERIEEIIKLPNRNHSFSTYLVPFLTSQLRIIANNWIPGRKILAARNFSLGPSTSLVQSNLVIEDGIKQCRYPYVSFSDFSKPWLERVLIQERVELNDQELTDFLRLAEGSFAVFPTYQEPNIGFVLVYLERYTTSGR